MQRAKPDSDIPEIGVSLSGIVRYREIIIS